MDDDDTDLWDASIDYDAIDRAWANKQEQEMLADEYRKTLGQDEVEENKR